MRLKSELYSAAPVLYHVTIDGANRGIWASGDADVTLDHSNIRNVATDFIFLGLQSGIDISDNQSNVLFYPNPNTQYNAISNWYSPYIPIDVNNTWWGDANPSPGVLFYDSSNVTYLNFAQSSFANNAPAKIAGTQEIAGNQLDRARELELNSRWEEALQAYYDIIASGASQLQKRVAVKSILRLNEMHQIDYSALRNSIQNELKSTNGWYKYSLDFVLCDILAKEGKYFDAIRAFNAKLPAYRNTPFEVECLSRIAVIYGDLLNDKANAKMYADKAAMLNPGQETLASAYASAGIIYDPKQQIDKFAGYYNQEPRPDSPHVTEDTVTAFPNPANPVTTIAYSIKNPSNVRLSIYSINGQKVATLVDGPMSAGAHAVTFDGSKYDSGVYFYRFESAGLTRCGKMLLLK